MDHHDETPESAVDFDVITVAYRSGHHFTELLELLAGLSLTVVDNSEPDHPAEFEAPPTVQLVRTGSNLGFAAAANIGFAHTEHPYVVLVNPDSRPTATLLDALVDLLRNDEQLAVCAPLQLGADGQPHGGGGGHRPTARRAFVEMSGLGRLFRTSGVYERAEVGDRPLELDFLAGACLAIRRSAFEAVGGFDERYFFNYEDVDLCQRLTEAGWRVVMDPSLTVTHFLGQSSLVEPAFRWAVSIDSQNRYLRRVAGPVKGRLVQLIYAAGYAVRMLLYALRGRGHDARLRGAAAVKTLAGPSGVLRPLREGPATSVSWLESHPNP